MNQRDIYFIIAIVALFLLLLKQCGISNENLALQNAAKDTLIQYRDKYNRQVTVTTALVGSVKDLKKLSSSKDSTLKRLQQLVDRKTIGATVISNVTSGAITAASNIIQHDTVRTDSMINVYPVYQTSYHNKWEKFYIRASRDSFDIQYKVFNDFDITWRYERDGLFKPKKTIVSILNHNPNTETLDMKNFTIGPPKQNRGIWLGVGVVAGIVGTFLFIR